MNINKSFGPHVSCRPGRVTVNQHIFKSGLSVRTFEEANLILYLEISYEKNLPIKKSERLPLLENYFLPCYSPKYIMNEFFIGRKIIDCFSKSLEFCFLVNPQTL